MDVLERCKCLDAGLLSAECGLRLEPCTDQRRGEELVEPLLLLGVLCWLPSRSLPNVPYYLCSATQRLFRCILKVRAM